MKNIESRVREFFSASSESPMVGLERWFFELGVAWVLRLDFDAPPKRWRLSWIRGLTQIMEAIHLTNSFFSDHGHGFVGMPTIAIGEEEVESGKQAATGLDLAVQFALFFQEAMSKMLLLVDVMFSTPPQASVSLVSGPLIHGALSKALSGIRLQFHSPPPAEVKTIEKEMVSLLSAKQDKAFEAIWSALEEIKTRALNSMEEHSSGAHTLQESSDIHEATHSVMRYIHFLLNWEFKIDQLVSKAVPHITGPGEAPLFISLIMEMLSPLQEFLFTKSQSFLDQGFRFLFLLNNSNYIRERVTNHTLVSDRVLEIVTRCKEELGHYIQSFIQVSWAPMLSCLSNPTPLCFGRNHSPLSKFECEFQKTYSTQKLWKVPDPNLRKRLRRAVIEKIIPAYTKYIEDSKVTDPKITPQKLEEMLQELFEG